jgi:hydroxyacylglutathione hydrolase
MKKRSSKMEPLIETIATGPFMVNCYIVADRKAGVAAVIDPGYDADNILLRLAKLNVKVKYILLTHAHVDHIGALKALKETTGAELLVHKGESLILKAAPAQSLMFGLKIELPPKPDRYLEEGEVIKFGSVELKVIHTPGHSPGGLCFSMDGVIFVGDTLFAGSIGRTDLPGGSHETLIEMIRTKLFVYPDDTQVLSGHGPATTIGYEKNYNPFF